MIQHAPESPEKESIKEAVNERATLEEETERNLRKLLTNIELRRAQNQLES